jgi:hypothetical protein
MGSEWNIPLKRLGLDSALTTSDDAAHFAAQNRLGGARETTRLRPLCRAR